MKKRLAALFLVALCLGLFVVSQTGAISHTTLISDMRYRLANTSPDFEDADLHEFIAMANMAVSCHGLATVSEYTSIYTRLIPNQQHLAVESGGTLGRAIFVRGVSKIRDSPPFPGDFSSELSLLEIGISDIGHKELSTDVEVSYFFQYQNAETTYIFVYPAPTDSIQLFCQWYQCPASTNFSTFLFSDIWYEALINYALMLAWIRIENYVMAAECYNTYQGEISHLRTEFVNRQPEITVSRKILE